MKIAILTSGGDCQGMNACILSAYQTAKTKKIEIFKVIGGFDGLIDNKIYPLNEIDIIGRENLGGTILKSARSKRFYEDKYVKKSAKNLKNLGIEYLIILGGNGSFKASLELQNYGISCICLPATIDNDLNMDRTLGFDTALNNIVNAIENISDCTKSFGYGAIVEIMGRHCSDLTDISSVCLQTKLVVKSKEDLQIVANKIKTKKPQNFLILLMENTVDLEYCKEFLQTNTKYIYKPHRLGYIQRGGRPSAFDRWYGSELGRLSVEYLSKNKSNFALGYVEGKIAVLDIQNSLK